MRRFSDPAQELSNIRDTLHGLPLQTALIALGILVGGIVASTI